MSRPVPPATTLLKLIGETEKVHAATACWLTMKAEPAIVAVPIRGTPVFASIVKLIVAPPEPLAGDVNRIQGAPELTVHAQPDGIVSVVLSGPPDAPIVLALGESATGHVCACDGAADCLTVMVADPNVTAPVRSEPGFRSTCRRASPLPEPSPPDVIEIHGT